MVAGFAIDAIGYRWTMLLLACFALAALGRLMARRIEVPPQPADAHGAKQRRLTDLLKSRTMRRVFIVSGLLSMVWDLFSFVVPIHGHIQPVGVDDRPDPRARSAGAVFVVRLAMPLVSIASANGRC